MSQKTMLFFRRFKRFSGGHLKVRDYFSHAGHSPHVSSRIFVTPDSLPDHPWAKEPRQIAAYDPEQADILFLAGLDWAALDAYPGIENHKTIINLIQHVHHADPANPRHGFLGRRAIRICVSADVETAILATGRCNGPTHVIPAGIDFAGLPTSAERNTDVFIAGLKNKQLANQLGRRLEALGIPADVVTDHVPRDAFLARMASAAIAVTLPKRVEGFYLPALEAMALGCAVICPDCIGNRSFCIDRDTCLMPDHDVRQLVRAVQTLRRNPALLNRLTRKGRKMAEQHDISREREAFLTLLGQLCNGSAP